MDPLFILRGRCPLQIFLLFEKRHFLLDGDRAQDHFVLQKDTDDQEYEIETKHGEAQEFIHPPLAERNGEDDKKQHNEEEDNSTEQSIAADSHWGEAVNCSIHEPWKGKAEKHKEKLEMP